jgi:hypothetical protein
MVRCPEFGREIESTTPYVSNNPVSHSLSRNSSLENSNGFIAILQTNRTGHETNGNGPPSLLVPPSKDASLHPNIRRPIGSKMVFFQLVVVAAIQEDPYEGFPANTKNLVDRRWLVN